ncbi:MAG: DUF4124 domain-containing protein [Sideroxydans sp.]|nr:DUF4124 domain-containing protein [Sideroxydans sp.]NOT97887.1 DUF4124 domain-containing protein [Sideroxydans sp.]
MKRFILTTLVSTLTMSGLAQAEIYKRVDKEGRVTYSSAPVKGGQKLELAPLPTMQAQKVPPKSSSRTTNADFPKVDGETQSRRDDTRRKILEDELATEQQALKAAQEKLQVAQDSPQTFTGANGQTYRNVAKHDAEVSEAEDELKAHESNIKALKSEIANLK